MPIQANMAAFDRASAQSIIDAKIKAKLKENELKGEALSMVHELYRDNVLTPYQFLTIIAAL